MLLSQILRFHAAPLPSLFPHLEAKIGWESWHAKLEPTQGSPDSPCRVVVVAAVVEVVVVEIQIHIGRAL